MRAFLLVDLQYDFMPGGALAVAEGDLVVPVANRLVSHAGPEDLIVLTQDWHPADHQSFAAEHPGKEPGDLIDLHGLPQVLWPVHCVQESHGAEFVSELDRSRVDYVARKGTDREVDSYSGFYDNGMRHHTGLEAYLRQRGVDELLVMGLATEYCVKWTALDAATLGFKTRVVVDACRGVATHPDDVPRAFDDLFAAGVGLVASVELLSA